MQQKKYDFPAEDRNTQRNNPDFAMLIKMHPESILVVDDKNRLLFYNPAATRLLCRLPEKNGRIPAELDVPAEGSSTAWLMDIAGEEIVLSVQSQRIKWHDAPARVLNVCDITTHHFEYRQLEQLVYCDHLTGLYNRRGLELIAERHWATARRAGQSITAFYFDVNGLKKINDTHGHSTGDEAILETAELLRHTFRDIDVKARLGGDEFVVLVADEADSAVETLTQRLQQELASRNAIAGRRYALSVSIGVGRYDASSDMDILSLLEEADRQMYTAKHKTAAHSTKYAPLSRPSEQEFSMLATDSESGLHRRQWCFEYSV